MNSKLYNAFIENFPGFISIRDKDHKMVYLNQIFKDWIAQYTDIDVIGLTNDEISATVDENVASVFISCHDLSISYIYDNSVNNKIIKFEDKANNATRYFDILKFKSVIDEQDYIFTLGKDVTHLYDQISYHKTQSYTDPLTEVYNRKLLDDITYDQSDFFIYIDLDNFKAINDSIGHAEGDNVLINFSKMLTQIFRTNVDYIIRLGGDEFLVIVKSKDDSFDIKSKVDEIQSKFTELFSEHPELGMSVGYSPLIQDIDTTLKYLDDHMYRDKKAKK